MVRIDKTYVFNDPERQATLLDLFDGRRQLVVQHSCSIPNGTQGARVAPRPSTRSHPAFSTTSSYGNDFNYDFPVTLDASVAPVEYNFRDAAELQAAGMGWLTETPGEQPGYSMFLRDGDDIFHTYALFGRGTEMLGGAYAVLDLTALGRQEEWEEPKGRAEKARGPVPDFSA